MPRNLSRLQAIVVTFVLLLTTGPAGRLAAQDVQVRIHGRVTDESGQPVAGATVTFVRIDPPDGLSRRTVTSAAGAFDLTVPAGGYRWQVSRLGLTNTEGVVTAGVGRSAELVIRLRASTTPLIGLTASRYFDLFDVNYFAAGLSGSEENRDPLESANQIKFHVAFRYKVIDWRRCGDCRSGLYLTYAQTSFWHLYDASAPFFDNNYSPGGLAYVALGSRSKERTGGPAVFGGFLHESNGRDFPQSRGWNRWVGGASIGAVNRTRVSGSLAAWHALALEPTNHDLVDYAGRGEIEVFVQPFLKDSAHVGPVSLQLRSRLLGRQPVTNLEANLLVHLTGGAERWFTPSLFVQLFSGYAENLLTYQEKRTVVRAGVALVQ
jgi:outer membrane phospholipase A